jgi:hypothetical protein
LIATGSGVRRVSVQGAELDGIHYLRTLGNSDAIRADAAGKRVVLIGGSYIATAANSRSSACRAAAWRPLWQSGARTISSTPADC